MSVVLHLLALAGLFAVMGLLTEPPGTDRSRLGRGGAYLAAAGIALLMTLLGLVVIVVMIGLYMLISDLVSTTAGVFLGLVLVMVASGVVLFLVMRPIMQRLGVTHEWLTIVEYYIQWSLIYVTIYQVIVENVSGLGEMLGDRGITRALNSYLSTVLDPKVLIVLLLPVLIAVWITTAMVKLRIEAQDHDSGDFATLREPSEH